MQVVLVDDIADDHRIAGGRVPRYPVTILLQHLDHKGLLLLLGGDFTGGEQIIVIRGKICVVYPVGAEGAAVHRCQICLQSGQKDAGPDGDRAEGKARLIYCNKAREIFPGGAPEKPPALFAVR